MADVSEGRPSVHAYTCCPGVGHSCAWGVPARAALKVQGVGGVAAGAPSVGGGGGLVRGAGRLPLAERVLPGAGFDGHYLAAGARALVSAPGYQWRP